MSAGPKFPLLSRQRVCFFGRNVKEQINRTLTGCKWHDSRTCVAKGHRSGIAKCIYIYIYRSVGSDWTYLDAVVNLTNWATEKLSTWPNIYWGIYLRMNLYCELLSGAINLSSQAWLALLSDLLLNGIAIGYPLIFIPLNYSSSHASGESIH